MKKLFFGLFFLLPLCFTAKLVNAKNLIKPSVILDAGHNPEHPGALGIRGVYEITYNDNMVAKLAKTLRAANFTVLLTRKPKQSISLLERAAFANQHKPAIFIAIHHDSAQPRYLQEIKTPKKYDAYRSIKPIAGYSIFVSEKNSQFASSYRLAKKLGEQLIRLGRSPSLHHAENISGENRELLDKQLGIYRFDNLVVLKNTQVPALLLEVGVIVNDKDERYVTNTKNQNAICQAIVKSIQNYLAN